MEFKDTSSGGGGFFKPDEHKDAVAILLVVKKFVGQMATTYGPKDTAYVDIDVFATQADLDAGKPTFERKGHAIQQSILARDLQDLVGAATIVVLDRAANSKPGQKPAWVWRQPSDAIKKQVREFAIAREEAVQAAIAAAPSFDD